MVKSGFSMKGFLNEASKAEAAPPATADPSGFVVHDIPYDKIKPSERNKYGIRDIEELAATIDEVGLLHNIVVAEPDEAGFYELISGERRYRALGLLKWATVPCKIEGRANTAIDELKLIFANSTARILTDSEKTVQAGRIKELMQQMKADGHKFKGRMREIVAEILKVSSSQVGRMESINKNLSPELKAAFEREEIGITEAYNASLLNPEEQAAALEKFEETGQLDTKKTKAAPKPEKPPDDEEAMRRRIEEMKREDAKKAPKQPAPERDAESGEKVFAWLDDVNGKTYEAAGSLAVIAAVDGEEMTGHFSTGEAGAVDYIMLATAIVGECLQRLGDGESRAALQQNLAALFNGVGGVIINDMEGGNNAEIKKEC